MQRTYRVPLARTGWVALLALLVLFACPGTSIAGGTSESNGPAGQRITALLEHGAGYGADKAETASVKTLQRTLRRLGWQPGPVDGLFGPRTEAAVLRFQHNARVAVDGIVGPQTSRALDSARTSPLRQGVGFAQPNGSPRVRTLQTRLRRLDLRPGPVDGLFGPRTKAAVVRFQHRRGLSENGVATRQTGRLIAAANAGGASTQANSRPGKSEPRPAKSRPQEKQRRAAATPGTKTVGDSDASSASDGVDVPLLIAVGGLALLVGGIATVLLMRMRREPGDGPVPLAHHVVAEGSARSRSIGAFRGRVLALVVTRGGLWRRPETRYLVSDPSRQRPFWVTSEEVSRLIDPQPEVEESPPEPAPAPAEEPVRALGYVGFRDSGELAGLRLQKQADEISALCDERGWKLVEVVRDVEESGDRGLERPGLRYAIGRIERGEASCLVVAELGGISRSAAELRRLLALLWAAKGRLVALDVDLDTASPEAQVAINALTAVGGWEGEPPSGEQTPPPQQAQPRVAALRATQPRARRPDQDVPSVKARIAGMREQGMTLQAIADQLNDEGVPTLGGGVKWRPSSVRYAANTALPGQNGVGQEPSEGGAS